jgi:hypothetical protein
MFALLSFSERSVARLACTSGDSGPVCSSSYAPKMARRFRPNWRTASSITPAGGGPKKLFDVAFT